MPTTKNLPLSDLKLDLDNYRTVHQRNETNAANALISIHPEWFWALMHSLLDDGYLPTENIIVLKNGKDNIVKEGNRRIASLKIACGLIRNIDIPTEIQTKIDNLSSDWHTNNATVPCAIYPKNQSKTVTKIVARTHAKGQSSGRDNWTSVARARFGRDENGDAENGLTLLEKYLKKGKNHSSAQAERWSGDYPLSVLDEAIKKLTGLLALKSSSELVKNYPTKNKRLLDKVIYDIGVSHLGFKQLRDTQEEWQIEYGLTSARTTQPESTSNPETNQSTNTTNTGTKTTKGRGAGAAKASTDPKSVKQLLKNYTIRGNNRAKIVTLKNELQKISITDSPHAFCFVLRSIFEISAKAYCDDHKHLSGPSHKKPNGEDKRLVDVLRDVTNHLTQNKQDKSKVKHLHGAMTELAKQDGLLSVTSMNQLVHHPSFSVQPSDISVLFGNLFPLLEELNT